MKKRPALLLLGVACAMLAAGPPRVAAQLVRQGNPTPATRDSTPKSNMVNNFRFQWGMDNEIARQFQLAAKVTRKRKSK